MLILLALKNTKKKRKEKEKKSWGTSLETLEYFFYKYYATVK
jgi:hypothetical protein